MGKVNFKYRIGQKVYWKEMYSVPYMKKCEFCDGSGNITNKINNMTIECPKCSGKGEINSGSGSIKERVASGIIENIKIEITKENGEKGYYIEINYSIDIVEKSNYLIKDECELYINRDDIKINDRLCAGYTK